MTLAVSARRREQLHEAERRRMLELMTLCYDNIDPARFFADLDDKSHVLVLRAGKALVGFSTLRLLDVQLGGARPRPARVLYSGDTVIHPDHWGSKALQRGFVRFTMRARLARPTKPLYWLLLSKGYKTYLLLTNNFPRSFPRRGVVPDPALVALRDRVATTWWGDQYDPQTEILRFAEARDRLKRGVAPVDEEVARLPDVAFFVERNPGWERGDELVCLAEIDFGLPWRVLAKRARAALARLHVRPSGRATIR